MKLPAALILLSIIVACGALLWSSTDIEHRWKFNLPVTPIEQSYAIGEQSLPMTFAHADHSKQQCVACHHNYQDDTGQGLCIDCHRTVPETALKLREQFHSLCMGCHLETRVKEEETGPLRNCKACHTEDHTP